MSYQVLARKWRPKSFTELIGQAHVVTVLTNALAQQRLHHAYLFTGTRGVGKTTIARIFAKSLNCQQGITENPCGDCDACVDIDNGRFVDLIEIDAASRTKVDDTREILDNVQYAPTRGRYKVYLIDEVHMLSRSSFNALLKTLEEPPEHVKFILATTDPQKLPITVLSRCLQFHLKALTVAEIERKVIEILAAESVGYEAEAISLLAKAAKGSMRDCLSLTDQSIAQGNGHIYQSNVLQMLGGVDRRWVFKLLIELLKQDAQALMKLSLDIAAYAPSYSQLMAELIQLLHQVAMAQVVDHDFGYGGQQKLLLQQFCQLMAPDDVQLYYQIVLNARKDLSYAADEQAAFDMMLLRLLAFKPMSEQAIVNQASIAEVAPEQLDNLQLDMPEQTSQLVEPVKSTVVNADQPVSERGDRLLASIESAHQDHNESSENHHENTAQLAEEMFAIEQQAQFLQAEVETKQTEADNSSASMSTETQLSSHQSEQATSTQFSQQLEQQQQDQSKQSEDSVENTAITSPIASVIETRNMLRSRKKRLEDSSKKPREEATSQEEVLPATSERKVNVAVPAIECLPQQPYSAENIDPSKIRSANQIDKWANMIDSMSLIARLRQLAIHATIDENSTDDLLILQLDQSIKHLNSDSAHKQLQQSLSEYLQRPITVELNIVEKTVADPYQIQTDINEKRYNYAKQLLQKDDFVMALQQQFQAELDQESIVAL